MSLKILSVLVGLFSFFLVIELVRREKLTFKYAFGWLFIALLAVFFSIFDRTLEGMAHWLGFELVSNFIFFVLLCFFVFLSILLTTFLCEQDSRNDAMAQKIGILEMELKEFKERIEGKDG